MTERVTIEGSDLLVREELVANRDPKRRRPDTYTPSTVLPVAKSTGRTLEQIVNEPNPYWPEQMTLEDA